MATAVSAAGGRGSEQQVGAAVEKIKPKYEAMFFSHTATGHNGAERKSSFQSNNKVHIWRRIEVVITGLTRNQFAGNRTWVRIPPSPPKNNRHSDTTE